MAIEVQDPAVQGRASRDPVCSLGSCNSLTATERQAQILAVRFRLSPWTARRVAWLCFGEGGHD